MMANNIVMLLLVPCVLLGSTQAWIDVKDRIKDRVIHIESLDERGRWFWLSDNKDTNGARYFWFNTLNVRDTYYQPRVQFQTSVCGGGKYICLESLHDPRNYVAAGFPPGYSNHVVKLVSSSYVEDKVEYHWKFLCEDDSLEKCKAVPIRFESENYLLVRNGWDAFLGLDEDSALIRIHAPNPSDGMREIYRNTNTGPHDHLIKYLTTNGVSKTHETSDSFTSTTSAEIGGAFKAFSASVSTSFSDSWTNTESSTYEESTTIEHDITIPGRTRVSLYQLVGKYAGAFDVYSYVYCIEEESLDDGATRRQKFRYDIRNQKSNIKAAASCTDV